MPEIGMNPLTLQTLKEIAEVTTTQKFIQLNY